MHLHGTATRGNTTENKFGNIETGEVGGRVICIFCPLFVFRLAHTPARPGGTTRKCLCHGDSPKQRRLLTPDAETKKGG